MLKVYTYAKCSTCRKAVKFLQSRKIAFRELPIRETPPALQELKVMLGAYDGQLRKLFNTSGNDYKALGLSVKLAEMKESEALKLLAGNGNLVKRPFVIGDKANLVGFDEDVWRAAL
ncbi:MAG: Spx/MgsR family RNA polymerase-binding regulatory protein [Chthoniobacterales bacterium]